MKITAPTLPARFWQRFWIMLAGILCMGFFLSFLRAVGWGTDPYTFMNESIRLRLKRKRQKQQMRSGTV